MIPLKTRNKFEKLDIEILESKCGLKFPPLYRIFIETFKLGEKGMYGEFYEKGDEIRNATVITHYLYDLISFEYFFDVKYMVDEYADEGWYDEVHENKVIPLAPLYSSYTLFVGTTGNWKDKVLSDIERGDGMFHVEAENVFEFIRGLKLTPLKSLYNDLPLSVLHKKWDDRYWKIEYQST